MSDKYLVHSYNYNCGGIGDLFRSIISFYTLCKKNNIAFYIDFTNIPEFKNCFITNDPPTINLQTYKFIEDHNGNDFMNAIIHKIIHDNINIKIISNGAYLGIKNDILSNINHINEIIKPSQCVLEKINQIFLQYNLHEKKYISFHLRCGDYYLKKETLYQNDGNDKRTNILMNDIIYYDNIIQNFIKKNNVEYPIIIHSDSNEFKTKMKMHNSSYIFLDIDIQHVCNSYGKNTIESFISTLAEFYILSKSAGIIMPVYSGFSHIASIIGTIPLYIISDHVLINNLGPQDVFYI